jgi:diacylglycerol kinase family enzyme
VTRSYAFLVNPSSGGGAAAGAVVPVARLLREAGASVDVTYSPGAHAMVELVDEAVGRGDVVVSVGGDGMLSSLAGLVSARGGTLGVVPAGRGNDFARMLGVPADPAGRARLLLTGVERRVDLVAVSGVGASGVGASGVGASGVGECRRVVAGSVYAGVDARAAEIVDRAIRVPARLQYPYAALRSLATYRPGRYRVVVDGVSHAWSAATVVVANSAYYGQGMRIAPSAAVDDGRLEVVVIEAASRIELMRSLPKVYDGSHVTLPEVTVLAGSRVELSGTARAPIPVGGDGEPVGVLPALDQPPAVLEVLPGALKVLA